MKVRVNISLEEKVLSLLDEEAKKAFVDRSTYISLLVLKKASLKQSSSDTHEVHTEYAEEKSNE